MKRKLLILLTALLLAVSALLGQRLEPVPDALAAAGGTAHTVLPPVQHYTGAQTAGQYISGNNRATNGPGAQPVIDDTVKFDFDAFYLGSLCSESGYTLEDCTGEQLVIARAFGDGTEAHLFFFEKADGKWRQASGIVSGEPGNRLVSTHVFMGREGTGPLADDYHAYSPVGLYSLGPCFGKYELTGLKMDYFVITDKHRWVGDHSSQYYNKPVVVVPPEGFTKNPADTYPVIEVPAAEATWNFALDEHLIEYLPNYDYSIFIQYHVGCAYFIHVKYMTTGGCIGLERETMYNLLYWIDQSKNPQILIYTVD